MSATETAMSALERNWGMVDRALEDMELILRGLNLQIRASGEGVQIEGCVPAQVEEEDNLVTIAQTSA